VEEATTTIVLHTDQAVRVDSYGHLFVGRGPAEAPARVSPEANIIAGRRIP
jgi:hypothetical protein